MCKSTLGHDGHRAVPLQDQAEQDTHHMNNLAQNVERSISQLTIRMTNIREEERLTMNIRKKIHKVFIINCIVRLITTNKKDI